MYEYESLPKKLKEGREYRKLHAQDLAKLFNIRPQSYSRWERGKAKPRAAQIAQIANEEKLDINYFFLPEQRPEEADWANKKQSSTLESLAQQIDELKSYIMEKNDAAGKKGNLKKADSKKDDPENKGDDEIENFITMNARLREFCSKLMNSSPDAQKRVMDRLQGFLAENIRQAGQEQKASEEAPVRGITIPFYGQIAAGKPLDIEEYVGETITVPETYLKNRIVNRYFAVKAKGDSMIEEDINDGDIVILKAKTTATNGDIVAVNLGGEATLKRIYFKEDAVELHPCNRKLKPMVVKEGEFLIQGIFAGVVKDYKIQWLE